MSTTCSAARSISAASDSRSLRIARDLYAKACEIDPGYARARAGMAICESHLSMRDPGATEAPLRNSDLALELAPNSAEAHAARGLALYVTGYFAEAAALFDRAMTLDANLFEAYFFDGRCRRMRGQRELAAARFARAAELRPNDFRSVGMLAEEYRALGRLEEARAAERRCLERLAAEVKAHPENADAWAFGSAILAHLDEPERATVWASRAMIMMPGDYLVLYNIARTYALLGDAATALDRLELCLRFPTGHAPPPRGLDAAGSRPRCAAKRGAPPEADAEAEPGVSGALLSNQVAGAEGRRMRPEH